MANNKDNALVETCIIAPQNDAPGLYISDDFLTANKSADTPSEASSMSHVESASWQRGRKRRRIER